MLLRDFTQTICLKVFQRRHPELFLFVFFSDDFSLAWSGPPPPGSFVRKLSRCLEKNLHVKYSKIFWNYESKIISVMICWVTCGLSEQSGFVLVVDAEEVHRHRGQDDHAAHTWIFQGQNISYQKYFFIENILFWNINWPVSNGLAIMGTTVMKTVARM